MSPLQALQTVTTVHRFNIQQDHCITVHYNLYYADNSTMLIPLCHWSYITLHWSLYYTDHRVTFICKLYPNCISHWCLRRILDICWYHRVSNRKVRRMTEQPPLMDNIQKRRLTLFGHLARMDETADARRILTGVHQSDWSRPVGRTYTSWMATLKSDLALHNLTF